MSTIGQNDSAAIFKPNVLKAVHDNALKYGKEAPEAEVNFNDVTGGWVLNAEFTSTGSANVVSWAKHSSEGGSPSGDITLSSRDGTYTYAIGASNSSAMTTGDGEYILYLDTEVSPTGFQHGSAATYEEKKTRLPIATMAASTSPAEAVYEVSSGINLTGGENPKIKARPEKILSPAGRVMSGDGTNSAPTFSFTSDPNTGMYQYADDQVGIAAGGTLRAIVSGSGISVTATVASDIEANINSSTGLLTKVSSSRRYKDNIEDLDINTENIYDLRPVSFDWKSNGKSDFGFIAEEVHEILPELVVYQDGDIPEAVKYKQLAILMLEELKKLRAEVKELKEEN